MTINERSLEITPTVPSSVKKHSLSFLAFTAKFLKFKMVNIEDDNI